ncbi:hypothetical protein ACEPAG_6570 [Sanghuangporus baumii]
MPSIAFRVLSMFSLALLLAPTAIAAATAYGRLMLQFPNFWPGGTQQQSTLAVGDGDVKVPVTLGVMSRCPDALICEATFDKVIPQVADKIDLSLEFIGKINDSEPDFGVTCLHGPGECAGNVQELCATKYLDVQQWWAYLKCQNFNGRKKVGEPDIALKCADTAKFDWLGSGVGLCAGEDGSGKGEEGIQLLKDSVRRTEELGIEKSCTVLINNKPVCIHDGAWKECQDGHAPEDFIKQINAEYEKLNMV